jgi:hypothetical protein
MYYENYDPSLHDIYLYGPGNTGYPIGINPNSLIAGASGDFRSVSPRYRAFTATGPIPIPPGTSVEYLPNYYNIKDTPLNIVFGDSTIASTVHYFANKPSDTIGFVYAKYTGTTTAFPIGTVSFWNSSFSGLCGYGPWTGIYNCVPANQITGSTSYAKELYFSGSPEIPGFATGSTFYEILNSDHGFMDLLGSGPTLSQPIAKIISIGALANDALLQGNTVDYLNYASAQTIVYIFIETPDLYFWDGCDKIIPISKLAVGFSHNANNIITGPEGVYALFPENSAIWVGDSSSQIVYKKNNSLYFIGTVTSTGSDSLLFDNYIFAFGPLYASDIYPLYNYLGSREIDKNHYWYPLNQGLTLATQIDFTRIEAGLNNLSTLLNNVYQQFI